ncbi:MAG: type II secretion system protein GspF, partial [Deltaproteobacteria bacterium]|nr:type II secretion system protein GspF [Deltaproteobacteria bacterium]
MALFDYNGFDSQGKKAKGSIDASSKRAALDSLREQGFFISTLEEQQGARRKQFTWSFSRSCKLSVNDLATTTRLLAT